MSKVAIQRIWYGPIHYERHGTHVIQHRTNVFDRKVEQAMKRGKNNQLEKWAFRSLVYQIMSLEEVPKMKQNFQINKIVTVKTPFFVIGSFCTHHSICLNISF